MTQGDESTIAPGHARVVVVARTIAHHLVWLGLFALPAIVLWWHVWTGHPSSTLTCACGDPAQEVWFIAWPAWALSHGANIFFSGVVNVPHGANLLSNTSGPLVGVVLSPITWLWGPVTATNVALTLAPAVDAWGCWLAIRSLVTWKPAAVPAALVYGYSSAIVTSLIFGHVSVTILALPPLIFTTLHEIVVRQQRSPRGAGLRLAALVVLQFLISPEVLVMCALFGAVGLVVVAAVGWRQVAARAPHTLRALAIGVGISAVLVAYPAWFGLAGPQAVSGVLFALAPLSGVFLSGFFSPGRYAAFAPSYVRFGGYSGRIGPPPDYLGLGIGAGIVASAVIAWRRPIVWFLLLLAALVAWLSLGAYLLGAPHGWEHFWLPWRYLAHLPVLQEILPDQFAPLISLPIAFLLAIGLDGLYLRFTRTTRSPMEAKVMTGLSTMILVLVALVPVFFTFDMPYHVVPIKVPVWMTDDAPKLPADSVVLTVPFAVSGSASPMLWQAVDDMHFRLAGAALKTPNANGGPVGQGSPGSARRILSDLTFFGTPPAGTLRQIDTVRRAIQAWHVTEVVIDGNSSDPVYTSGFLTEVLGEAPTFEHFAWVWKVPKGPLAPRAFGASLYLCRLHASTPAERHHPLSMANCVVEAAARR